MAIVGQEWIDHIRSLKEDDPGRVCVCGHYEYLHLGNMTETEEELDTCTAYLCYCTGFKAKETGASSAES